MDRDSKLTQLRKTGTLLRNYTDLQGEKEAVLIAVNQTGLAYKYASPEMKASKDIRLAVARQNIYFLDLISPELRDKEVMMAAVENNGAALEFASPELRGDKELVMVAVQHGFALRYADPVLRADKEVVMAAVTRISMALQHASPELRADKEVVMAAVQKGEALEFASPELRADKEVVLASVRKTPFTVMSASAELQRDGDVIRELVKRDPVEGQYNNINMGPGVGDYVTLALKESQSNPVVHTVTGILPDGRVQLNNKTVAGIYCRFLNFVPPYMVMKYTDLGLRLRDRTFTIKKGGKNKRLKYGSKKQWSRIKRSIRRRT